MIIFMWMYFLIALVDVEADTYAVCGISGEFVA